MLNETGIKINKELQIDTWPTDKHWINYEVILAMTY